MTSKTMKSNEKQKSEDKFKFAKKDKSSDKKEEKKLEKQTSIFFQIKGKSAEKPVEAVASESNAIADPTVVPTADVASEAALIPEKVSSEETEEIQETEEAKPTKAEEIIKNLK